MPLTVFSNRLTPSEIESLREDKKAASAKLRELIAERRMRAAADATRLTPTEIEALREDKKQATAVAREWLAQKKAASSP